VRARPRFADISQANRLVTLGAQLHPGSLPLLTRLPASDFTDRSVSIEEGLGVRGNCLIEQLNEQRSAAQVLRLALPLFICVMLAACLTPPSQVTAQQKLPMVRTMPLFDFHSNFWVNLHQVLLHEAKLRAGKPERGLQSAPPLSEAGMSKQDKAN